MTELRDFKPALTKAVSSVDEAAKRLNRYFACPFRTGKEFERYECLDEDSNRITPSDLVATTLLSIGINKTNPGIWPLSILKLRNIQDQIAKSLRAIAEGPFAEKPELHKLSKKNYETLQAAAIDIHECLLTIGIPRVARYKLLARKRPLLFPIRDGRVEKFLGVKSFQARNRKDVEEDLHYWYGSWHLALNSENENEIIENAISVKNRVAATEIVDIAHLGVLRILDIIMWESEDKLCVDDQKTISPISVNELCNECKTKKLTTTSSPRQ